MSRSADLPAPGSPTTTTAPLRPTRASPSRPSRRSCSPVRPWSDAATSTSGTAVARMSALSNELRRPARLFHRRERGSPLRPSTGTVEARRKTGSEPPRVRRTYRPRCTKETPGGPVPTGDPPPHALVRSRIHMIEGDRRMRVCIVGASGKLGRYMVEHALDRGYEVVAVCREQSVGKLAEFEDRISIVPGATDDDDVIKRAVSGCDGVLVVLVPRGVHGYSTGTAQAVLDHAEPDARLVFSCGWHISRDGQDVYSRKLRLIVGVFGPLAKLARFADLDDQVEACRRVFASDARWTVVRGSDLEEGDSQGLPVWSRDVGDPVLESNLTRRVDFALFMVEALENDELIHEAPAIVGRQSPSALAHAAA